VQGHLSSQLTKLGTLPKSRIFTPFVFLELNGKLYEKVIYCENMEPEKVVLLFDAWNNSYIMNSSAILHLS
jgi:hypothetical protein